MAKHLRTKQKKILIVLHALLFCDQYSIFTHSISSQMTPRCWSIAGTGHTPSWGAGLCCFHLVQALVLDKAAFGPLAISTHLPGTCWQGSEASGSCVCCPKMQLGPYTQQLEPSRRKIKVWSCSYREYPQTFRL